MPGARIQYVYMSSSMHHHDNITIDVLDIFMKFAGFGWILHKINDEKRQTATTTVDDR